MAKWLNKWYMVNDKMVNDLVMEKKLYICPLTEVTILGSDVIMQALGPASMPKDPNASTGRGPGRFIGW